MQKQELQFQNDMLIRFIRLTAPVTNNSYIPLSGLYNPIDNNESNDYYLRNKFKILIYHQINVLISKIYFLLILHLANYL
jgi:hypothetical protein